MIDHALVPGSPFRPSLQEQPLTGLLAGLLLGVGLVFLLDFLDRSLKSAEELEQLLGLPVLAVIPDVSDTRGRATATARGTATATATGTAAAPPPATRPTR